MGKTKITPASVGQVKSLIAKVLTWLLGLITEGKKDVPNIDFNAIQKIIDGDDKKMVGNLIEFINRGFEFVIVVAQHVINFDLPATVPFSGATLNERIGLTGTIAFKPEEWIAKNELQAGETYITGHEYLKRLKASKNQLPNSNQIDWLVEHQNEPGVKEFLEQYKGKVLYAFGDVFRGSGGGLYVRCMVWDGGAWVSDYGWLDGDFYEHRLALLQKTK